MRRGSPRWYVKNLVGELGRKWQTGIVVGVLLSFVFNCYAPTTQEAIFSSVAFRILFGIAAICIDEVGKARRLRIWGTLATMIAVSLSSLLANRPQHELADGLYSQVIKGSVQHHRMFLR